MRILGSQPIRMGGFLTMQRPHGAYLDRYQQIKFLGRGGFGAAYLFKDTHHQRHCVIKVRYSDVPKTAG